MDRGRGLIVLCCLSVTLLPGLGCTTADDGAEVAPSVVDQPSDASAAVGSADGSMIVMDDFESGEIIGWKAVSGGSGGWFVYSDGSKAPEPTQSDPNAPFDVPDPPGGRFAIVTDSNGPGTRILYRDVELRGRLLLHLTVFYEALPPFASPDTLAYDSPGPNQQFRIDLIDPEAPIDSVAPEAVLLNVFRTSPGDPARLQPTDVTVDLSPWADSVVRLRLAGTDNRSPLHVGVDDIRFEPTASDDDAGIELLVTDEPDSALDLVLKRMTEGDALAALSARTQELASSGDFSGAVLVAKHGEVIFREAHGLADREQGIPNTVGTRFRIGSMNKMFTAVAILQLVEAGLVELTAPLGRYLDDYPNQDVASKVTIHHLLTHIGGTGDIFGLRFEANRSDLRTLDDYVDLYGDRGLQFEPGSRWSYSNYGFILLGVVIEEVTGETYYDYVQAHIYEPAGMTGTGSLPEDREVQDRAIGYSKPPGASEWTSNTDTLPYRGTSAGGGYSTVEDMALFAQGLLGHELLSSEYTNLLLDGKVETFAGARYAYGFEDLRDDLGIGYVGHGGGAPGMNGDLRIYTNSGYVVAVLANLDPPAAQRISEYLDPRLPEQ